MIELTLVYNNAVNIVHSSILKGDEHKTEDNKDVMNLFHGCDDRVVCQ